MSLRPQYHSDMGVITTVGLTALTRILCFPSSNAETRVIASTAPLEDAYETCPANPTSEA